MAIVLNTVSEQGDVLIIQVETPILGIVLLSSFLDNVEGESATKYFNKQFRYSLDGITYSNWQDLTNENILGIQIEPTNLFRVEYRYERIGTDNTGLLTFNEVTLNGQFQAISNPDLYDRSIFAQFFDFWDPEVLTWALNVLEKIYRGIIPKYIERGQNDNSNWEDRDFIDFWMAITHYFAIFVRYIRLFENIGTNKALLLQYLENHDLYICNEISESDLIYLMNNLFDEIRQRGTIQIALSKEEIEESSSSLILENQAKQIDGELLRLICKKNTDEFIFCPVESWKVGWFLNQSSPMYKGINAAYNAIKGYEKSEDFIDLNKYPLVYSQYCSTKTDGSKKVLSIDQVPNGIISGISADILNDFKVIVDPSMDYEITFWMKQDVISTQQGLDFAIKALDSNGNQINMQEINLGNSRNYFANKINLNQVDKWYFVRGIIYHKDADLLSIEESQLDLFRGSVVSNHLRFSSNNITYIIPTLALNNESGVNSNEYLIWDFKIRPLKFKQEVCGFLGIKNLTYSWLKNNSNSFSNDQITDIMKRKLMPYNQTIINEFL